VRLARAIAAAATDPAVAEAARIENPPIARRHFESSSNAIQLLRLYGGLRRGPRAAAALPRSTP
jgi:hypothetical protein